MLELKHIGGEMVKGGSYWNFSTGERVTLDTNGRLPGDSETSYYKVHPVVLLIAGPMLGLVYAVFLPFIGIAAVIKIVGEKLLGGIVHEGAMMANFGWRPVEAYFSGKRHKKGAGKEINKMKEENKDK